LSSTEAPTEKLPVDERIKVIDYATISKKGGWWTAVVLGDENGRKKVMLYMWYDKGGKWARRQKFTIARKADWASYKEAVERMLSKME